MAIGLGWGTLVFKTVIVAQPLPSDLRSGQESQPLFTQGHWDPSGDALPIMLRALRLFTREVGPQVQLTTSTELWRLSKAITVDFTTLLNCHL